MEGVEHRTVSLNSVNIHVAEMGQGPIVLLIHGFPECWFSWRNQISFLASHGYRAVAPDMRGYGETTGVPTDDPSRFTTLHVVGDLVALINEVAPPQKKVFVVGHDWGAFVAWALCLYRPDKVKALVNLSLAFTPRNPSQKPLQMLRAVFGDDYYMCRFQKAGEIESEFAEIGTKTVLKNFFAYRNPAPLIFPKGKPFPHTPIALPPWLSEEDVDFYANKFQVSGFTGALNYYRALDLNWELTAPWTKAQVSVPVMFIVGDLDLTYNAPGAKEYIHNGGFKRDVPLLKEVVVIEGTGHFVHEEKPAEVNAKILEFFSTQKSGQRLTHRFLSYCQSRKTSRI